MLEIHKGCKLGCEKKGEIPEWGVGGEAKKRPSGLEIPGGWAALNWRTIRGEGMDIF